MGEHPGERRPGKQPRQRQAPVLVLDFDGVICDSVQECWVSSWKAYHELFLGRPSSQPPRPDLSPPDPSSSDPPSQSGSEPGAEAGSQARTRFRALRPYVRSGEDFVMIQQMVAQGTSARSQAEFDRQWDLPGAPSRQQLKDLFYRARTELMERDTDAWLAMNRIFPHVPAALAALSPRVPMYILSTKKARFVSATLKANRLAVPEGHVLYSEAEPKLQTVERLMRDHAAAQAVFVEDQVDALRANRDPRIQAYLATWGYVQEEWLRDPGGIRLLDPNGFVRLLASL